MLPQNARNKSGSISDTTSGSRRERTHSLRSQIQKTIHEFHMIAPGDRVAVACSGGADSTALLLLLHEMAPASGWVLSVAHLNHCLRGGESDGDEEFVRRLAGRLGLEFHVERADVGRLSKTSKTNLEAQARKSRLHFFRLLLQTGQVDCVALAHTSDDQTETVLQRFLRGSGTRGLAGIAPVMQGEASDGKIIRPLLEVRRAALREWLASSGEIWREDLSNQDLRFLRNRIRHELIPKLATFNPRIIETLSHTADLARQEEAFWESYLKPLREHCVLREKAAVRVDIEKLRLLPPAAAFRVLRWAIAQLLDPGSRRSRLPETMDYLQVQGLLRWALEGRSGHLLTLPKKVEARKEFSHLILVTSSATSDENQGRNGGTKEPNYRYEVQVPSMVRVPEANVALQFEFIPLIAGQARYNESGIVLLDGKLARSPLLLRNWQAGDAYQPQGHRNKKKLRDLLQRARIPLRDRAAWPVLTTGEQIIWVRGLAVAEGVSPSSNSAQAVGIRELGAE